MSSLDGDQERLFARLRNLLTLSRPETELNNDYYESTARLKQLGLAIPPELAAFSVFLAWPQVAVDGIEQRLDVTGFRLPGQPADEYLWETWQYNDLDEAQSWAHTDALALARSYICVGTNAVDREHPLVTVESPLEMITLRDPATRRVTAALRLYAEDPDPVSPGGSTAARGVSPKDTRATLYLPGSTHWLRFEDGQWVDDADPDFHRLGVVPVVPLVNRARTTRKRDAFTDGVSEMAAVIPVAESASRAVTNAQLAQETHAVPHRVLLGAKKTDFVDQDGQPTGAFSLYMSSLTTLSDSNAKATQFDATDMGNFETMVNMYARLASGVAAMPVEYFGLNTDNAPSAEGQRAGETRLIKKAERKQTSFGHAWEAAMRLVLRFRTGGVEDPDPALRGLEAMWRDAGTPTRAQSADAVTKLFQVGLIDWETAQEDLGRTPAEIEQMRERRNADVQYGIGAGVDDALAAAAAGAA